jgi:hypothetical protein
MSQPPKVWKFYAALSNPELQVVQLQSILRRERSTNTTQLIRGHELGTKNKPIHPYPTMRSDLLLSLHGSFCSMGSDPGKQGRPPSFRRGPTVVMHAFFPLPLPLPVALHQEHDAASDRSGPARGRECAAVAHFPETRGHRPRSVSSVRVVAVQKDSPFAAAHQTVGLDSLRLAFERLLG